jgi:peroxiredoxin
MVLLNSLDIPLGHSAKDFQLPSVDGKQFSLDSFKDAKVLVIMFICNHCPYVKAVEDRYIQIHRDYAAQGVQMVGICSNDPTDYPEDAPEKLLQRWQEKNYGFPYLIDETQDVARDYGAVCTPDIYVFDKGRNLAYHGRIDDNWKEPSKVTHHELREALDLLLAGKRPDSDHFPSMGCSIKWKK